jgi:hypothetical protein
VKAWRPETDETPDDLVGGGLNLARGRTPPLSSEREGPRKSYPGPPARIRNERSDAKEAGEGEAEAGEEEALNLVFRPSDSRRPGAFVNLTRGERISAVSSDIVVKNLVELAGARLRGRCE